jgi:hypothetical protein
MVSLLRIERSTLNLCLFAPLIPKLSIFERTAFLPDTVFSLFNAFLRAVILIGAENSSP